MCLICLQNVILSIQVLKLLKNLLPDYDIFIIFEKILKVMKKNLLIILLSSLVFCFANAQSFDVIDENDNSIVSTNFNLETEPEVTIVYDFRIVNLTSESINTRIEKKVINAVDGSVNFFCIPSGLCIQPASMMSPVFEVEALDTTKVCQLDYIPGSNTGTSTISYVIFNDDDPSDYVEFTVNFVVGGNNVLQTKNKSISVYPNPAKDFIVVEHSGCSNSIIEIYNMLGNIVARYESKEFGSSILIDSGKWNNGVYFARLTLDNNASKTIRFVVSK